MSTKFIAVAMAGGPSVYAARPNDANGVRQWHPSLQIFEQLAAQGMCAWWHCAGNPFAGTSHFYGRREAMDVGNSLDGITGIGIGNYLLGRTLGDVARQKTVGLAFGDELLPRLLEGPYANCASMTENLLPVSASSLDAMVLACQSDPLVPQHLKDTYATQMKVMADLTQLDLSWNGPALALLQGMEQNPDARIAFMTSGGFDTHTDQANMFTTAANALAANVGTLCQGAGFTALPSGEGGTTPVPTPDGIGAIILFSEFGRTAETTTANGSSHGEGGLCIVISPHLLVSGAQDVLPDPGDPRLRLGRFIPVDQPLEPIWLAVGQATAFSVDGCCPRYSPMSGLLPVLSVTAAPLPQAPPPPGQIITDPPPPPPPPEPTEIELIVAELRALADRVAALTLPISV